MTNPQFNSQEGLEAYLAAQNQRREAKSNENVMLWKTVPLVFGCVALGFGLMFYYPSIDLNSSNGHNAKGSGTERIEILLGLLGVDIEEHQRQHEEFIEELKNSQ